MRAIGFIESIQRHRLNSRVTALLGSARVPRAGDGVLAIADFSGAPKSAAKCKEVRFGATPKPARETRALTRITTELDGSCP